MRWRNPAFAVQLMRKAPPPVGSNVHDRRSPYRIPYNYDPRVSPRVPDSWRMALFEPWRTRLFGRAWGRRPVFPTMDAENALIVTHKRTYPVADSERVQWWQPFRCQAFPTVSSTARPVVFEILRVPIEPFATGVLERIATYLRVTPLDAQGAPSGPEFVTGPGADPCVSQFVNPAAGNGVLNFRWFVVADELAPNELTEPNPLVAAQPEAVPLGLPLGIARQWNDLRYAFGNLYSSDQHILVQGPILLRFFFEFQVVGSNPFRLAFGGLLGGYTQSAGRMARALRAATERFA
jgi:hypothetical protein